MAFALVGARVFDGERFLEDAAVVVKGRRIVDVIKALDVPPDMNTVNLYSGILAPGFIDVQVNGGGGALLNMNPSVEVVRTIAESHRKHGTVGLLPTVITDAPEVISAAVTAVRDAKTQGAANVLGIHVEGPFLDPVRKGAHDAKFIRAITENDIAELANANCGAVMLTLAPNKVPPEAIRKLAEAGVRISLGHSDATFEEATSALKAGASAFTHLFNAMSQMAGREPGMVGAAFADKKSFIGIIADGHHVHEASMRAAFAAAGTDRFMLVSDAMPPVAGGPDMFELQGRKVTRVDGRLQLEDGTLAGSNLTMDEAVRCCVLKLKLPLNKALQMASRNPANFLGRDDLGRIAPGALASLVHLDDHLEVLQTWVEGQ
jgi:N-acetylglucosamine-6-phosphate deacetylase